jgi:hypothetical protein
MSVGPVFFPHGEGWRAVTFHTVACYISVLNGEGKHFYRVPLVVHEDEMKEAYQIISGLKKKNLDDVPFSLFCHIITGGVQTAQQRLHRF